MKGETFSKTSIPCTMFKVIQSIWLVEQLELLKVKVQRNITHCREIKHLVCEKQNTTFHETSRHQLGINHVCVILSRRRDTITQT